MGIFNNFINKFIEPQTEEYQQYKKQKESVQNDIIRFKKYIVEREEKLKNCDYKLSPEIKEEIKRWKYCLQESEKIIKFLRPNDESDISYRNQQCDNFIDKLRKVKSDNLDLRFHGTPIYYAQEIIKTGTLSSSADRFDGYMASTDMHGEISVSNIDTLSTTINCFSDIVGYYRCLPCGCIFALLPKNDEDANLDGSRMYAVNLNENPQQLYGIFTSPENIHNVKKWMIDIGFTTDKVFTFEEFLDKVEKDSIQIDLKINKKDPINDNLIDLDSIISESLTNKIDSHDYINHDYNEQII